MSVELLTCYVHVYVCQVPMMDIAGRRPLLLFPMLAMILDLALMTVCLVLQVSTILNLLLHSSDISQTTGLTGILRSFVLITLSPAVAEKADHTAYDH